MRPFVRIAATVVTACVSSDASSGGCLGDHLFAIEGRQQGAMMLILNPDNGDVVTAAAVSGSPILGGIAFDGWTLAGVDALWTGHPDRLFRVHPSDANGTPSGPTGLNWNSNYAIEWDPQNAWFWVVFGRDVFSVDPSIGTASYRGSLAGLNTYDEIAALARDLAGSFIGVAWPSVFSGSQGVSVYALDFAIMSAVRVGGIPGASFSYDDLAFDSRGVLWATAEDITASWPPWRLCQIDLSTMTRSEIRILPIRYAGLASVPDMQVTAYCQPKLGSLGCAPTCAWAGLGSPTASSGFEIRANDVISGTWGSLYYGIGQQAALPFGGGTLCIRGSLRRAGPAWSGGSPWASCGGAWSIDFNEWMATHVAIPAGTTVRAQWLGRDPGYAPPDNWQMSNALEFVLRP